MVYTTYIQSHTGRMFKYNFPDISESKGTVFSHSLECRHITQSSAIAPNSTRELNKGSLVPVKLHPRRTESCYTLWVQALFQNRQVQRREFERWITRM